MHSFLSKKYDLLARLYDPILRHYTHVTIAKALELAPVKGESRVCDIGCGTGSLEKALLEAHPGLEIAACDLSRGMIKQAKKKMARIRHTGHVHLFAGDFMRAPFERRHFDTAFSLSNLHYFPDPHAVFERAAELSRPGGHLIIVDWSRDTLQGRFYRAYMSAFDRSFRTIYTPKELEKMLRQTGWRMETEERISIHGIWTMMAIRARLTHE